MASKTRDSLSLEIHSRLDVVSQEEWQHLFPGFPDSLALVQHIQECGMDKFSFHSILVRDGERPILLLPLFETRYEVHSGYHGVGRQLLDRVAQLLPNVFYPKIMGVGFVEGEWGQIGFDSTTAMAVLEDAWTLALNALDAMAVAHQANLMTFLDFNTQSGAIIPLQTIRQYAQIASNPCGILPIQHKSLEEYLESLSKATRKDLRRKMKKADAIEIRRTTQPGEHLERIYQFYRETVARADASFGVQRREYFRDVCEKVPGAEYTLYLTQGKLVGFNLLIRSEAKLVDKYFGMEATQGRELNLYFLSWLENIRYCIEQRIPEYHAGPAAEGLKSRLAAQFTPSMILFRHRNPLAQKVLTTLARYMGYEPEIDLPKAELGSIWATYEQQRQQNDWQPAPSSEHPQNGATAKPSGAMPETMPVTMP